MTELQSDYLAERYGVPSPRRRRAVVLASGLVGVLALAWLGWAAWFQGTPDVQSSLRSFEVTDSRSVTAAVVVKPTSAEITASCLVRAFGEDHSVVGELNFRVADQSRAVVRTVSFRTEREATSVELIGCTTADQPRPR